MCSTAKYDVSAGLASQYMHLPWHSTASAIFTASVFHGLGLFSDEAAMYACFLAVALAASQDGVSPLISRINVGLTDRGNR